MICLCMIVKNESKIIKRCLDSVKNIIDSWCIVDTGSTDNTKEIILKELCHIPGKLIERPWINFGHNRTEVYEYSKEFGDWALLLDADMILENNLFNKNELDLSYDSYYIIQKDNFLKYYNIRLINLKKEWKCIGVTHEYWSILEKENKSKKITSLEILDIGDGGNKSEKFSRDIELLIKGICKEPENIRYKFYLAQSYKDIGNYEVAIPWYEECSKNSKWDEESWYSDYMIANCLSKLNNHISEIEKAVFKAWIKRPWRIEPLLLLNNEYKKKNNWIKSYYILKLCETIEYPKNDVLFIEHNKYGEFIIDELSIAAYNINKLKESAEYINRLLNTEYGKANIERILNNKHLIEKAIYLNE